MKRAVLASGSLFLSSPLPVEQGDGLIQTLEAKLKELGQPSLRQAPVPALIQVLKKCNVNTMWIQEEPGLKGWETRPEQVDELMIGDTEYEVCLKDILSLDVALPDLVQSIIWRNGVEQLEGETIAAAFGKDEQWGTKLRKMYQVVAGRPTACKLGALDLVNDIRYTLPVEVIAEKLGAANKRVYKYVFDQPNPWQQSSRAHHAVDLLFLFGGVDLSFNSAAETVGQETRKRWIQFVNGKCPWSAEQRFAFGPFGECKEISEAQFASRRRVAHLRLLEEAGMGAYMPIVTALTAGKISLSN
jgi:hypothetical protein